MESGGRNQRNGGEVESRGDFFFNTGKAMSVSRLIS